MTTLADIEKAIAQLSAPDLAKLRDWLAKRAAAARCNAPRKPRLLESLRGSSGYRSRGGGQALCFAEGDALQKAISPLVAASEEGGRLLVGTGHQGMSWPDNRGRGWPGMVWIGSHADYERLIE